MNPYTATAREYGIRILLGQLLSFILIGGIIFAHVYAGGEWSNTIYASLGGLGLVSCLAVMVGWMIRGRREPGLWMEEGEWVEGG